MKKCPHCGKDLPSNARFCLYCMNELEDKIVLHDTPKRKKYIIAVAAAALFLLLAVAALAVVLPYGKGEPFKPPEGPTNAAMSASMEEETVPTLSHGASEPTPTETPAHTHTLIVDETVKPTCTEKGREKRVCSVCGKEEIAEIPALGHSYENDVCTRCGLNVADVLAFEPDNDGDAWSVRAGKEKLAGLITVPASYNGKPVTGISDRAFEGHTEITQVQIPDSVRRIGARAFSACGIEEIVLPEGIESIGSQPFYQASSLKTVFYNTSFFPESGTNPFLSGESIEKIVFNCRTVPATAAECLGVRPRVREIVFGDKVRKIGSQSDGHGAFKNCASLEKVTFRPGLQSIGAESFSGCTALFELDLPDGVVSVAIAAFKGCASLQKISLPASLRTIGSSAFADCPQLKKVYYRGDLAAWLALPLNGEETTPCVNGSELYIGGELLKDLILPDDIHEVVSHAFYGCTSLSSVILHGKVEYIGINAFRECTCLTSIEIPDSVSAIGSAAFYGCSSLEKIAIPESVAEIGPWVFKDCTSLSSVSLPSSLSVIEMGAFYNCPSLRTVSYAGTQTQWVKIFLASLNSDLEKAERLYEQKTD